MSQEQLVKTTNVMIPMKRLRINWMMLAKKMCHLVALSKNRAVTWTEIVKKIDGPVNNQYKALMMGGRLRIIIWI